MPVRAAGGAGRSATNRLLRPAGSCKGSYEPAPCGGYMYAKGGGVPQSFRKAVKWTRKAADQGLADAQYNIAEAYVKGEGVPQSYATAAEWLRKAADRD